MTEESKQNLLDFMIGKLPNETGIDEPQFNDVKVVVNHLKQFTDEQISTNFSVVDYLQNSIGDTYLLYGNYSVQLDDIAHHYGAIVILNSNFQPLQAITTFESGTLFNKFEMLKFNENGTIYGVDNEETFNDTTLETTNKYRFIMLNNVLASGLISDKYSVSLQTSYYFPSKYNTMFFGYYADKPYRMYKKNGEASYIFIGRNDVQTSTGYGTVGVLMLNVNVGSENEWIYYEADVRGADTYIGSYINWNDEIYLKIYLFDSKGIYIELLLQNENLTILRQMPVEYRLGPFAILNENNVYMHGCHTGTDTYTHKVYKFDYANNNLTTLYEEIVQQEYVISGLIAFNVVNGELFLKIANYKEYDSGEIAIDSKVGMIVDDKVYLSQIGRIDTATTAELGLLFVKNEFNLYTISVQNVDNVKNVAIVYNRNNYNGKEFVGDNSLLPNSSILYSEEIPVFARNLYNKTTNENITMTTVEVPNTYLNNTTVDKKNLLSKNNNVIVSNIDELTKNIYETLYINFINSISIVDDNLNNSILNSNASTKLNQAINNTIEYENIQLTKCKINYQDGTNTILSVNKEGEILGRYILSLVFYLNKKANNLEFISNDEQTVYCTVDLSNYEANKYYSLTQRVRIGG